MPRILTTLIFAFTCIALLSSADAGGCRRSRSYSSHSNHGHPTYHVDPYIVPQPHNYLGQPYPGMTSQGYPSMPGQPFPGVATVPQGSVPGQATPPSGFPPVGGFSASPANPQLAPGTSPFGQLPLGGQLPGPSVAAAAGVPDGITPPGAQEQGPVGPTLEPVVGDSGVAATPAIAGPTLPTQFESPEPTVVEASRFEVYMSLALQLSAPGCGDVPGYCVLSFAGFEMPLAVTSWQDGMIEVQMPTLSFVGATDATMLIYNADRTLFAELPLTLLNSAP